jgi:hypothetical protein
MAVAMTAVSPNRMTTLPLISLIILLDTREVFLIEGIFHESDSDPWHWKTMSSFTQDSLSQSPRHSSSSASPPCTPRYFPNSLKDYAKRKHNKHSEPCSLIDFSLPSVYSLCSISILTESTRYALIVDGVLYVFDWKAVADEVTNSSKHHNTFLHSRTPRGSRQSKGRTMMLPMNEEESQFFDANFRLSSRASVGSQEESQSQLHLDDENSSHGKNLEANSSHSPKKTQSSVGTKAHHSLFQLIRTSPASDHFSEPKLRIFLKKFGQYPTRYRPLVWRYLLQLPENEVAFSALCTRQSYSGGAHEDDLKGGARSHHHRHHQSSKVKDRRVSQRLRNVCRLLTLWSPVFGEVDYVPQLVFPFSLIFGSDEMSCLETVMTLLMWYGHSWQATYPSPPIHITDAYDRLLEHHDPRLHKHLLSLETSPGPLAWHILSTFFSEILPSELWLSLMDRIFTDVKDVNFVYLVPLAILRLLRISLLSTTEKRHVTGFLREPQSLQLSPLLKMISEMKRSTPTHLFSWTSHTFSSPIVSITPPPAAELEKTHVHLSVAAQEGKPLFPLPKGQYPAYDGYPAHLLDWQVQERARVLSMKREIQVREDTLLELENHIKEVIISPTHLTLSRFVDGEGAQCNDAS